MVRADILWCAFVSRFVEAHGRYRRRGLTADEAGELLGMSGRHFRRLCVRYEEEGESGLRDRRVGAVSSRRADAGEIARMRGLYRERYHDFTAQHFHEVLRREHNYKLGYTVTRLALQSAGLLTKAVRRGVHRKKRVRRPMPGMLLFQDGSTHCWLPAPGGGGGDPEVKQDLIVTMDDATGAIYSIFLVAQEGTVSSFQGLSEVISEHGLFSAFYTDRGSHYFTTPKAGGKVDKSHLTQVGRALAQLGIRHIPSYSPQARGRMERVFGTLQHRLPQELRILGLDTMAAANAYLRDHFMADYNARFAVTPAEPDTAFVAYQGVALAEVLCVQEDRQVGRDNCVRWHGMSLQIPAQLHRQHYVKVTVLVRQYGDANLAIFDGPRCLARYDEHGQLPDEIKRRAA